jgi:hypothetical protein
MTKSPTIKTAPLPLFKHLLLGGILFSTGIGLGQELPKVTLAHLAKIPASKFTKVIKASMSPDKRYAVALGSKDGTQPNWQELVGQGREGFYFEPEQDDFQNYLVDPKKDRVTGILDGKNFYTENTQGRGAVVYHWSPDGSWLVETQSWKWATSVCSVYRVDADGKLTGRLDFLKTAHQAVVRRVREKGGKVPDGEDSGYSITMEVTGIKNDGTLTANLNANSSKSKWDEGDYLHLLVVAKVIQSENGETKATLTEVKQAK